jgi:hypothetical protein
VERHSSGEAGEPGGRFARRRDTPSVAPVAVAPCTSLVEITGRVGDVVVGLDRLEYRAARESVVPERVLRRQRMSEEEQARLAEARW